MTSSSKIAECILHDLDIAVLRRKAKGDYEIFGSVPEFYLRLFPEPDGQPSCTPWKKSSMVDFFLHDAELFFSNSKSGSLNSGIWQEEEVQTGRQALTATAMCCGGEKLLIIRLLGEEFIERSRILQKARENLLERRELHNDIETYKQKARYDKLTSLYNRSYFDDALADEIDQAIDSGVELSMLMIDIDDFKGINDVYGHLAGDTVLSLMGQLLRNFLRREDIACRYGGEEFAVLAPMTLQHQAIRMAEKLRKGIAEYSFGDLPSITVSIGCATYRKGESPEGFISRADLALYDAKNSGKNMVRMR
ncbi:GGDEF domain-containing protein [Desulfovibrio sp. OttesenSCG-928-M16]|nr:GGDEF domain-containing protein [Desulfovibrio sp. OttesenSCG-928-M16]